MSARLWLEMRAQFAAFRWLQAGVFRATSPIIPPSAAWGLVLNLAGIETRGGDDGTSTLIRADAPRLRLSVGTVVAPERGSLYQQLHTYPVGGSGKERREKTHGAKYWIAPTRRELLVGFHAVVGIEGPGDVLERIPAGLRGAFAEQRYGFPFAGDNNLLFDRLDVVKEPPRAHWFVTMDEDATPVDGSCRLTVGIDRAEASRTTTMLFAPSPSSSAPQDNAWVWVPGPPA